MLKLLPMKKILFTSFPLLLLAFVATSQRAELHLINTSARTITAKVMQGHGPMEDTLYSTLSISPYGQANEYFAQSGNFYLKTAASLQDKETIYEKGNSFQVYVGADGHSVLTITFSITENNAPNPLVGRRISKSEFDLD